MAKTYRQLTREAERERLRITSRERKAITAIFAAAAAAYSRRIRFRGKSLSTAAVVDAARSLRDGSRTMFGSIQTTIRGGISDVAGAVSGAQAQYWSSINPIIADRVSAKLGTVPAEVVHEVVSGSLYPDHKGLSARIWRLEQRYETEIEYIIRRGVELHKSALELARDLEVYVQPGEYRPFDWSICYPYIHGVTVDFSAQRLARTSVTHAYQTAFVKSTRDNPFVVSYQWHASNSGRVCPVCAAMDGKIFRKDEVPLDHPMGMCTISAVIPKSYDEIADEISDWVHGAYNPGLDKWLKDNP